MSERRKSRELALQILYQADSGLETIENISSSFWETRGASSSPQIRLFAEDLSHGVMKRRDEIDSLVEGCSEHWIIDRMATIDRNIIRLAVYELLWRDDIPPKVTINEAVDIAKKYSTKDSGAFVNGILDRIWREESSQSEKN